MQPQRREKESACLHHLRAVVEIVLEAPDRFGVAAYRRQRAAAISDGFTPIIRPKC